MFAMKAMEPQLISETPNSFYMIFFCVHIPDNCFSNGPRIEHEWAGPYLSLKEAYQALFLINQVRDPILAKFFSTQYEDKLLTDLSIQEYTIESNQLVHIRTAFELKEE